MSDEDISVDSLDSFLVDLQIGEITLERFSQSLMKTHYEDDGANQADFQKEKVVHNGDEVTKANQEERSNSWVGEMNPNLHTKTHVTSPVITESSASDPNGRSQTNNLQVPQFSKDNENNKIIERLDELNERVEKILANGGGVPPDRRSDDLPYLGVTQDMSEMLLQHGQFPATPIFPPIPRSCSTPLVLANENGRTTSVDFCQHPPFASSSHKSNGLSKSTGHQENRDQTFWMREDSGVAPPNANSMQMMTPENYCNLEPFPKCNWSTGTSLPSLMSWGVGEGEAAWSTFSQASTRWASTFSKEASGMPSASGSYFSLDHSPGDKSYLNQMDYFRPDFMSCSYPETLNRQELRGRIPRGKRSTGNSQFIGDIQSRQKNRFYPYQGNNTFPRVDEQCRRETQNQQYLLQNKKLTTNTNFEIPKVEFKPFKGTVNPSHTTGPPYTAQESTESDSVSSQTMLEGNYIPKDSQRTSQRKALLQDVVLKESTKAFESHPLFPLLHDLAVTDYYFDQATFNIGNILGLLPTSTKDLVDIFLRRNPDNAHLYRTSTNHNSTMDAVIWDAIKYAHSCVLGKIRSSSVKESAIAGESERDARIGKVCYQYMDAAVRSSTPLHTLQTLNTDTHAILRNDSRRSLDQMLEPFSPIPAFYDSLEVPRSSPEMYSNSSGKSAPYPREVQDVLSKWLTINKQQPLPDDDQKAQLMAATGLSSKQVSDWFVNASPHLQSR